MKAKILLALGLLIGGGAAMAATTPSGTTSLEGDYVEARTASVFCGPCHYNGELVTTGRDAIMAWNVKTGKWNGVDLSGVKAMAAVTSEQSLGDEHTARKCEVVIDASATDAQARAFTEMLRERDRDNVGDIVSVKRAAVTFKNDRGTYNVSGAGFAAMSVQPMPDMECCKQPNLVWYSPLFSINNGMVGYTENAAYTAGTLGDIWQRQGENDAFYGTFHL